MNNSTFSPARYAASVWRRGVAPATLGSHSVDIWVTNLDHHLGNIESLRSVLSDRENQRVERLQVQTVADRYVISRGLLRNLLSHYTGLSTSDLVFEFGPLGKPSLAPLKNGDMFSFNNTDCREYAIYAFSRGRELGVDLECLPREVRAERISRRRFTKAEADTICALPEPIRTEVFLGCWTRKEAWGKALGVGIRYDMDSIDLGSSPQNPELRIQHEDRDWRLLQVRPDENSIACVIAEGTDWTPAFWQLTPETLINLQTSEHRRD